jgi:hypothetical protein
MHVCCVAWLFGPKRIACDNSNKIRKLATTHNTQHTTHNTQHNTQLTTHNNSQLTTHNNSQQLTTTHNNSQQLTTTHNNSQQLTTTHNSQHNSQLTTHNNTTKLNPCQKIQKNGCTSAPSQTQNPQHGPLFAQCSLWRW